MTVIFLLASANDKSRVFSMLRHFWNNRKFSYRLFSLFVFVVVLFGREICWLNLLKFIFFNYNNLEYSAKMFRVAKSTLRVGSSPLKWQQIMKISSTKAAYAAAIPEPQTNPDVLYTGVNEIIFIFHLMLFLDGFSWQLQLFINNEWYKSKRGEIFPSVNPATGKAIAQIQAAGKEDVNIAVNAARQAFKYVYIHLSHIRDWLIAFKSSYFYLLLLKNYQLTV